MANHKNHGKQIWISPRNGDWAAQIAGQKIDLKRFSNKADAVSYGKNIGKGLGLELIRDGN
ncbi:MAG: hypothetical protein RLZZ361_985 [Cyanobacteriota bacterium]|jgi:hypothetical protein